MDAQTLENYKAKANVIKALAHPTRLFIIDQLAQHGERCVCELTDQIGADMSTVSRHLSQMRQAGLIRDEKRGTTVYYSLRVPCVTNFFDCIDSVLLCDAEGLSRACTSGNCSNESAAR